MATPPGILPLTMPILKSLVDCLALWKMSLRQFNFSKSCFFLIKKMFFATVIYHKCLVKCLQQCGELYPQRTDPYAGHNSCMIGEGPFQGQAPFFPSRVYSDTSRPALLIKPTWMPNAGSQNKAGHSTSSKDIISSWVFIASEIWCIVVKAEWKMTLG